MKAYERALEELEYPQVPYYVQGGYGEPVSAIAAVTSIGSVVGGFVGNLVGMNKQEKMQQAQIEAQERAMKDQALIQGQVAAQQAQISARHAANMPIYLALGAGTLIGVVIILRKKK